MAWPLVKTKNFGPFFEIKKMSHFEPVIFAIKKRTRIKKIKKIKKWVRGFTIY